MAADRRLDQEKASAWLIDWLTDAAIFSKNTAVGARSNVQWQAPSLVVKAAASEHSKLSERLRIVREDEFHFQNVTVEVRIICGPTGKIAQLFVSAHSPNIPQAARAEAEGHPNREPFDGARGTIILSEVQVSELLSSAKGDPQFSVTSVPRIAGLNGQFINIDCGPRKTFVKGLKPGPGGSWVPNECTCCEGVSVVLHP